MQGGKYFSWLLNMVTWRDRLSAGIWEIRKDDRVRLAENCINQKWLIILTRKYRSGKYTSWTSSPLRSFPSRWRAHKVWFVIHKPIRFVAMTTDYRLIQYYLSRRVNNWTCHLLFCMLRDRRCIKIKDITDNVTSTSTRKKKELRWKFSKFVSANRVNLAPIKCMFLPVVLQRSITPECGKRIMLWFILLLLSWVFLFLLTCLLYYKR